MIQSLSKGTLRSSHAACMLIRYIWKVMDEDPQAGRGFYELLEGWLRHKNDMVTYEAARAICSLRDVTAKELFPAVGGTFILKKHFNLCS